MSTVLDEMLIELGFDADTTGIDSFSEKIGHLTNLAVKAGTVFTAVGGIAAAVLGKSIIDTASTFEQFETQLNTIEGSSEKAQESLAWISEFGAKTPYDVEQVTAAFVKLKAYGLDPINGDLLRSLGDTASAMGKPLEQAVEAIADAVRGENERLKEFGIIGSKDGDTMTYTYDYNGESFTKEVSNDSKEIQKALQEIFDQKFSGGMDKMSETWAGMLSNLEDQWTAFKLKISKTGIFDKVKGSLKTTIDYLNNNQDKIDSFAQAIGDGLSTAFDFASDALFDLWDSALYVRDAFKELDSRFQISEKMTVAVAVAVGLLVSNMALLTGAKIIGGIQSLIGVVAALTSPLALAGFLALALFLVIEDIYGFINGKDSLIGKLAQDYPQLYQLIDLFLMVKNGIKQVWAENKGTFRELFDAAVGLIDALKPMLSVLINILPPLLGFLLKLTLAIFQSVTTVVTIITKTVTGLMNIISSIWSSFGVDMTKGFTGVFSFILGKLGVFIDTFRSALKGLGMIMNGDIAKGVVQVIGSYGEGAKNIAGFGNESKYSSADLARGQSNRSYNNQSTVNQSITVNSASEAAVIASRTAQATATRQSNVGYI